MGAIIDKWLDQHRDVESDIFAAIGKDGVDAHRMEMLVDNLREEIASALDTSQYGMDTGSIDTDLCSTIIRGLLLEAWLQHAGDPGLCICRWLWGRAPAGLSADYSCLHGLFPKVPLEEPDVDVSELSIEYEGFVNYAGVEEDDDVFEVLRGFKKAGYLKKFDSLNQVVAFLGEKPVLTKVRSSRRSKPTRSQAKPHSNAGFSSIQSRPKLGKRPGAHTSRTFPQPQDPPEAS